MNILEKELLILKDNLTEMLHLVLSQVNKSKKSLFTLDTALAEDIINHEKRVNALELLIDKQCANIFALMNPVASDLRLTLAVLKMNSDIERIGDHAEGIAIYVLDIEEDNITDSISYDKLNEMFDIAIEMLEDVIESIVLDEVGDIKKVFVKDKLLNKFNKKASKDIAKYVEKNPGKVREALYLFSTIKKVERLGDHIKNITEDWIYYLEGKVIKHKK